MNDRVTIRLAKEAMKFSAGHFTIFSATERERVHGHNFVVEVDLQARMQGNGMCFDYGIYKAKVIALCRELNEWMLLPMRSPHLRIETEGACVFACFNSERIPFLQRDVKLLDVANVTLEELAAWFLQRLGEDREALREHAIEDIEVRVSSGPGQSAGRRASFVE